MLATLVLCSVAARPITLYVSPKGDDRWSGRLPKANAKRSDGPFATVQAARDHLRKGLPGMGVVVVQPGVYRLAEPLVFTAEDSGTEASPRVYVGKGAILSGLRPITEWRRLANGFLQAKLPAKDWRFSQLFINGERRYRTRLPKRGYFQIAEELPPTELAKGHGYDQFKFRSGDLLESWAGRSDIELIAFHNWHVTWHQIGSVRGDVVNLKNATGYNEGWATLPRGNRYLVENVKESLSEPGEWYLDRSSGEITYVPMAGETAATIRAEAPVSESVVELRGDSKLGEWVHDVQLRFLQIEGGNWNLPHEGRTFPQAEADLSGTVRMEGARRCSLSSCAIRHTGTYAVDVAGACKDIEVSNNAMEDLGAGGVKVGETSWQKAPDLLTEDCSVLSNTVDGGGRIHPAAVGVWVGQNPRITIRGNTIRDLYYTGISVGWSWGYQENGAHHNTIEDNRISLIGQGVLSDMGGIYTLGPQSGTVIRGNRIHDVQSFTYGGWGIYPDEGSSGIVIENNCVFRTKSAGFHQHYGKENIVRNNVFAFGGEAQLMRSRAEDHLSFTAERNLVLFDNAPLLGSNWSGNNYKLDNNLYWRVGGQPFDFAGLTLEQWREKGQDTHSIIEDPMFVAPAKGDFRLKSGSPAIKTGFRLFPALNPAIERSPAKSNRRAFP